MDIEFHYYITYLIAARAGFTPEDAKTLAHSCQYTDENNILFSIDKGEPTEYFNYISQTMNITRPRKELLRIYPLFHFIPGDPVAATARRKDGRLHRLNTTPDSENAKAVIDSALNSRNIYRIGIACHAYADTFAHQNFVGYFDPFNSMKILLDSKLAEVGHAEAEHKPDWPGLIWEDDRLHSSISLVSNRSRFKDAAAKLYGKLNNYLKPEIEPAEIIKESKELLDDIDNAIGPEDEFNNLSDDRIKKYIELTGLSQYGGQKLEIFNEEQWLTEAFADSVFGFRLKVAQHIGDYIPLFHDFTWKDKEYYKRTHWYQFQEAVKEQQNCTWDILNKSVFSGLELDKL